MDVENIDREYRQLEQEAGETGQAIQGLAQKMQAAVQAGDANAKEWLLDFLGGGFGRPIEMGTGLSIGNSLISSIFGNL